MNALHLPSTTMLSKYVHTGKLHGLLAAFLQSKEISPDLCCFYGSGVSHNEDIMHSFQKFIVVSFPTTLPP